jgi:hypothetical protein
VVVKGEKEKQGIAEKQTTDSRITSPHPYPFRWRGIILRQEIHV